MKVFCSILVITLFSSVSSFAQLNEGKAALERGDLKQAVELLREAAKDDKKNPQTHLWLGIALTRADSAEQAVAPLVQARELEPNNPAIYIALGDAYSKQNIPGAAMEQYKRAVEIDSTKPDLWMKLADAYRKARKYNDAANAYNRVIGFDSTNVSAMRSLGSIFIRAKLYAKALPIYRRLYAVQPDTPEVAMNYARALSATGNWAELIPVAEKILRVDGSQDEVQQMLAEAYLRTGKCDQLIERYGATKPDSLAFDILMGLGKCYREKQEFEKATAVLQVAMAKDSSKCAVAYDLGVTYMRLKKWNDAVAMFDQKIACDTSAGYRFASSLNAGLCLMQLKEFEKAEQYIKKSIAARPENVQASHTLAQNYAQMKGRDNDAQAAYRKVIELVTAAAQNGNNAEDPSRYNTQLQEAYRMDGLYLMLDKKWSPAIESLRKALAINQKDCTTLLLLGQANQNNNNKDEAKKYYCRVLDTCPKGKEAGDAQKGLDALGMTCGQ